jgi:Tfp pilus assembly protein FimT
MSLGVPVAVCPKSVAGTTFTCGGSGSWANGWLVFRDPGIGGTIGQPESGADVIKAFDAPRGRAPTISSGGVAFVRFGTDGMQNNGVAAVVNQVVMTLDQPDDSSFRYRRCVVVNMVGAIRAERKTSCP